ncbi:MAG: uncharacterized protein KVP18_004149 [Porospora cf. gigantea A]|uniref:uncharacterized protein n=1 Tax=Porospora cf. gigantea A TaxID=2853593 RepID=UPI003559F4F1|nr:MAG: hypothetical protein KVP18_004149 [Porospora cf. gigantea A]
MGSETREQDRRARILEEVARRRLANERADIAKTHSFWATQPVRVRNPQLDDLEAGGAVVPQTAADISLTPVELPANDRWCVLDIADPGQLDELYVLLKEHYVEDTDEMFRFDYSKDFLQWALCPPGYRPEWHLALKDADEVLKGFISAVPANVVVRCCRVPLVEVNFLCVRKDLRAQRYAPLLIQEITRLVNLQNVYQALYTSGTVIPNPVGSSTYFHRTLNLGKLIDVGFTRVDKSMTRAHAEKKFRVPNCSLSYRPMTEADVEPVRQLLQKKFTREAFVAPEGEPFPANLEGCKLYPEFTKEEVAHYLLPRTGVILTYVRDEADSVVDVVSFYSLPSSVLKHAEHSHVLAAYYYYSASTVLDQKALLSSMVYLSKAAGFDVLNVLDLGDNDPETLRDLKFGRGDGTLHYYLYNWKCPDLTPQDIQTILV